MVFIRMLNKLIKLVYLSFIVLNLELLRIIRKMEQTFFKVKLLMSHVRYKSQLYSYKTTQSLVLQNKNIIVSIN